MTIDQTSDILDNASEQPNPSGNEQENSASSPIERINELLGGSPVLSTQTVDSTQPTEPQPVLASEKDFRQIEGALPFARAVKPRAVLGALLALAAILPLSTLLGIIGSDSKPKAPNAMEIDSAETAPEAVSPELSELQAENEQLKAQQAFTSQQIDVEAINAQGRAEQQQQEQQLTNAANEPTSSTSQTSASAQVTARPATASVSAIRATPPPRPQRESPAAPPAAPRPARSTPAQPAASSPTVDPFERRAQLQALGTYGSPPPTDGRTTSAGFIRNPFEQDSRYRYIQAISIETEPNLPQATIDNAPSEEALADPEYQEDAALVLGQNVADPADTPPVSARPLPRAIFPGTSVEAELTYGIRWREGLAPAEVLIETKENVLAGEEIALQAGTQMLAQADIDTASGVTQLTIIAFFEESPLRIPQGSIVVHQPNGSPLMAQQSTRHSTTGPNLGGLFSESLSNGLANIIGSNDNLAIDLAGGVAEAALENQRQREDTRHRQRIARDAAMPEIWSLEPGIVQLTFNSIIPLGADMP